MDLLNHFGAKNGFGLLQDAFENEDLDPVDMAAILKPLGNCAELLNPSAICPILTSSMDRAVKFANSIEDKDLKSKVAAIFKCLKTNTLIIRAIRLRISEPF